MNILKNRDVMKFLDCLKKLEVIEAVGVANFLKVDLLIREDKENADEHLLVSMTGLLATLTSTVKVRN